jgi:hypothetical protein
MRLEEEDGRMSDGGNVLAATVLSTPKRSRHRNLVNTGLDGIVCPPLQRIADVDYHLGRPAWWSWKHGKKRRWVAAVLHLKPTDMILEKKSYDTEVGMRPRALDLALTQRLDADLRIVQDAKLASVWLAPVHEGTRREFQANFHGCDDLKASALQQLIAYLASVAEPGKIVLFRPSVWVLGIVKRPYVNMLLFKC